VHKSAQKNFTNLGETTMKTFKLSAAAALLASFAFSASAMTLVNDEGLAQVSGQDGVSIVADLHVGIGSFTYSDSGNTVSFNNIGITGVIAATIDVISGATFQGDLAGALMAAGTAPANVPAVLGSAALQLGFTGQDVIQFAIPAVANTGGLNISVASITTGNGGASMGGIALSKLDVGGTKVWMFGHN
jgi:hypothetical protein